MREKLLKRLAALHLRRPWLMMLIVFILTLVFGGMASRLTMTTRWSDMLPSKDIRTIKYNEIIDEFTTATSIIVVVQGEENRIKEFAEYVVPKLAVLKDTSQNSIITKKIEKRRKQRDTAEADIHALEAQKNRQLIKRIDYKSEIEFIRKHGLILIKASDLENMQDIFSNPNLPELINNINAALEKEYVGDEESMSTRQKEDQAVLVLDGIRDLVTLLDAYTLTEKVPDIRAQKAIDKLLFGETYFLSYDKKALILNIIPNFTMMDLDLVVKGTDTIQKILNDALEEYPDVRAGLTGMIPVGRDEMVYSEQSISTTSYIAFIAILIMLIFAFRMWSAPLLAGLNLIVGIIWATGMAGLLIGQLNFMTSMFAVILLGLGIDFSIHIISSFTENIDKGLNIGESIIETFHKTGKGIITGGLTTSVAFLAMTISSSRGMKEMGIVSGVGLLCILIATFLFLPSLLVLVTRRRLMRKTKKTGHPAPNRGISEKSNISFRFLGHFSQVLYQRYWFTLIFSAGITVFLIFSALRITFDHNYMNIEPKGLTSIALQDTVMKKFDMSMDYGLVLTSDVQESREKTEQYRERPTVASVEDISAYLPSKSDQQKRRPHINTIHEKISSARMRKGFKDADLELLLQGLQNLHYNVLEMQDLAFLGGRDKVDNKCKEFLINENETIITRLKDRIIKNPALFTVNMSRFQEDAAPYFKSCVLDMCNPEEITLTDLPPSILDRYSNKTRDKFLVTVFPAGNIWQNAEFLERFVSDLEQVSPKATGMPPVFRALVEIIGRDGRNAALLTIVVMFFLLWYDFRRPAYALIAMIPLAAGVFWMVGLMKLLGQQLTVMNVMGLPLIIGIGIDDGVHIMHRWLGEGKDKIKMIFTSTGKAILLTSLTTMLGFGSLVFSIWRGFGQLGSAMFIGVAACFLTTVLILPGILGWLNTRRRVE
ncbi:MMPL family transporter [candidate division KSB1 bacterium]|nr:MMPL family transporter [candidate division KSB1 bacterium]